MFSRIYNGFRCIWKGSNGGKVHLPSMRTRSGKTSIHPGDERLYTRIVLSLVGRQHSTSNLMLMSTSLTWRCDTYVQSRGNGIRVLEMSRQIYDSSPHYFRKQCLSVHNRLVSCSRASKGRPQVLLRQSSDLSSYKARFILQDSPPIVYQTPSAETASRAIETDLK
jgi:hypothetical protein